MSVGKLDAAVRYLVDHVSQVGTVVVGTKHPDWTGTNYSIPNASSRYIAYIDLDPGTWIIQAAVSFAANSTGYRRIGCSTSASAGTNPTWCNLAASGSGVTTIRSHGIAQPTEDTRYYLHAMQGSGGNLNVSSYILAAVRIS